MRVFVAGATGAIGRRLVPQLVARGHQVTATTRSADKVQLLRAMGAEPVISIAGSPEPTLCARAERSIYWGRRVPAACAASSRRATPAGPTLAKADR